MSKHNAVRVLVAYICVHHIHGHYEWCPCPLYCNIRLVGNGMLKPRAPNPETGIGSTCVLLWGTSEIITRILSIQCEVEGLRGSLMRFSHRNVLPPSSSPCEYPYCPGSVCAYQLIILYGVYLQVVPSDPAWLTGVWNGRVLRQSLVMTRVPGGRQSVGRHAHLSPSSKGAPEKSHPP